MRGRANVLLGTCESWRMGTQRSLSYWRRGNKAREAYDLTVGNVLERVWASGSEEMFGIC
ncbi:MAG: hypothetical protein ACTS4U_00565 [Candidatus Hodgkinia cicadicola]